MRGVVVLIRVEVIVRVVVDEALTLLVEDGESVT